MHIGLAEGWFSLFLVATVVYSTIWCVQAVGWVEHLDVLSLTTLLGLVSGVIAAKQHRLPRLAVHAIAVVLGLLIAYWQTAGAFYAGNIAAFTDGVHRWIQLAIVGAPAMTTLSFSSSSLRLASYLPMPVPGSSIARAAPGL